MENRFWKKNDEFSFGHLEFQMVVGHPSGDIHWRFFDIWVWSSREMSRQEIEIWKASAYE